MRTLIFLWAFHSVSAIGLQTPEPGPHFRIVTVYFTSVTAKYSCFSFFPLPPCLFSPAYYSNFKTIFLKILPHATFLRLLPPGLPTYTPLRSLAPCHLTCGSQGGSRPWKGWRRIQTLGSRAGSSANLKGSANL